MGAEKPPSGAQLSQEAAGLSASAVALTGAQSATGNPAGSLSATPASRAAKGPGAESLVLEVAATERAWVAVDADGKTVFQRTLNPNEVKTFTAKDSFEVWTGNAQGTVLTLNGTKQRVLGRAGEIKRIRFTRDNLQQSAP